MPTDDTSPNTFAGESAAAMTTCSFFLISPISEESTAAATMYEPVLTIWIAADDPAVDDEPQPEADPVADRGADPAVLPEPVALPLPAERVGAPLPEPEPEPAPACVVDPDHPPDTCWPMLTLTAVTVPAIGAV